MNNEIALEIVLWTLAIALPIGCLIVGILSYMLIYDWWKEQQSDK